MKHKFTFFAVLMMAMAMPGRAQNWLFTDTLANGQVLYFDTLGGEARVVRPGTGSAYNNYVTGSIDIPSTVTYNGVSYTVTTLACVGNYGSFERCSSLTHVTIPSTITTVEDYAFYYCSGITDTLKIPSSVGSIGPDAFKNVPLIQYYGNYFDGFPWGAINAVTFTMDSLILGDSNYTMLIGYVPGITNAIIPNTVTEMRAKVFMNCSTLVSVTIPSSITTIPQQAFYQCTNLTSIDIPNSVTTIGAFAFDFCSNITSIDIPNSVTSIGDCAFEFCTSLSNIVMGNGVKNIGSRAFAACGSYASFTVPCSVDTVGIRFVGCPTNNSYTCNFTDIWFMSPTPPVIYSIETYTDASWIFSDWLQNSQPRTIHVPNGSLVVYQNAWTFPNNIILVGEDMSLYDVSVNSNDTIMGSVTYFTTDCAGEQIVIEATPNDGYSFRQWSNGSTSNPDTLVLTSDTSIMAYFAPDLTPALCMVTIQNEHNAVIWTKEQEVEQYNIYREGVTTGDYELVASVPYDSASLWIDGNSNPSARSYRYRMTVIDTFGVESAPSFAHKTMHLTISQGLNNHQWNLVWTEYEGADFVSYMIYRGSYLNGLELIDQMPVGGNTTYTDDNAPYGTVYYQIVAIKSQPCNITKSESMIRSNIATNADDVGIDGILDDGIRVYSLGGRIVVDGTTDEVQVFDIVGRNVRRHAVGLTGNETLPSGVYMVKIGERPARKVVVIR